MFCISGGKQLFTLFSAPKKEEVQGWRFSSYVLPPDRDLKVAALRRKHSRCWSSIEQFDRVG
jgi:hypothetical protein